MLAIYKKEIRSYMNSMIGYVFIFLIMLLTGIYFTAYQLNAAYPKFEYTLNSLTFVFIIGIPILTMRVFSEERKQKTDQMLLTAPISVIDIVMGKYLALITVYAIPMLILCMYPLLILKFGSISMGSAYTAILGFFLLGCSNLAIGMFLSSITESQIIAAVLSFIVLFAFYMMSGISSFFSTTALSTCVTFGLFILAAAIVFYTLIKNIWISAIVGVIGEIILIVIYVINKNFFEGGIQKVLDIFDLSGKFENFANEIMDITGIIYFCSVIAICLFLTIQSVAKRRWN